MTEHFKPADQVIILEEVIGPKLHIKRDRHKTITIEVFRHGQWELVPKYLPDPWWFGRTFVRRLIHLKRRIDRWFNTDGPPVSVYWKAASQSGVLGLMENWSCYRHGSTESVEVYGTMVPTHPHFIYGKQALDVLIYRVLTGGQDGSYHTYFPNWAPMLYQGPYNKDLVNELRTGPETVTDKGLHPRGGVLVHHEDLRFLPDGSPIAEVLYNPQWETANEIT